MGASISTLHGMEKAQGSEYVKNWVAVIGDSTFMHTGINSLMNMVYNRATGTVIILDNHTTGMTGHQEHAGTGKTLKGDIVAAIDVVGLCKALGVPNVTVVNAMRQDELIPVLRAETAKEELSVIIARYPCALLGKKKVTEVYRIDQDKCRKCGMCMKPGCPAITRKADGSMMIDDTMCNGCGLCEQLCKFGAMERVEK